MKVKEWLRQLLPIYLQIWKWGRCTPLALPEAFWQKLLKEQVLCADLITKEATRWQLWKNEAVLYRVVAGGVGQRLGKKPRYGFIIQVWKEYCISREHMLQHCWVSVFL